MRLMTLTDQKVLHQNEVNCTLVPASTSFSLVHLRGLVLITVVVTGISQLMKQLC